MMFPSALIDPSLELTKETRLVLAGCGSLTPQDRYNLILLTNENLRNCNLICLQVLAGALLAKQAVDKILSMSWTTYFPTWFRKKNSIFMIFFLFENDIVIIYIYNLYNL